MMCVFPREGKYLEGGGGNKIQRDTHTVTRQEAIRQGVGDRGVGGGSRCEWEQCGLNVPARVGWWWWA